MTNKKVVILGAGPAGLGAAYKLASPRLAQVTVLEQNSYVGGNASSFEIDGIYVDYGSHRLHPASDQEILSDIKNFLGDDLLDRPRHGRIRLRNRWIHFPLKPVDLALRLPISFSFGVASDAIAKLVKGNQSNHKDETFASVMEQGLGRTICNDFYFPYARKLWGLEPHELSAIQANRRVSNSSLSKMVKKVVSAVPGIKTKTGGRFFYPRKGFGQISEAYYHGARQAGADVILNSRVISIERDETSDQRSGFIVGYENEGIKHTIFADYIWSTIPITILARIFNPKPPEQVLRSASSIHYRAMILVYLVLDRDRFSEYDAHYFPETDISISRLSESRNYSGGSEPKGRTILCAELPCNPDSLEWTMGDDELANIVSRALEKAGIPLNAPIKRNVVKRLKQAYPIYRKGYEESFDLLDQWFGDIDGILSFGRQGLFAHDNTHHALYMAYCAADCMEKDGVFNTGKWIQYRKIFETHVVED